MSRIEPIERSTARRTFDESYLTLIGDLDLPPVQGAGELFELCAASPDAESIQERIFGPPELRGELLALRREVLEGRGLRLSPCTYLCRKPGDEGAPICVQRWGLLPQVGESRVSTVELPGGRRGRLVESPELRLLWMSEVVGTDGGGGLGRTVTGQAEAMFSNAAEGLARYGFRYADVVRTWISLRRILDWYGELNRVRTDFHRAQGITGGPDGVPFPASTGIQGSCDAEECVMDLLALQPLTDQVVAEPLLRSSRQDQPFEYGSGFSRGTSFRIDGLRTVLISGTASIGPDGRTRHVGDRDAQALETLLGVAALLEPLGGSLSSICAGTLFYKDLAARRAYDDVLRLLGVPPPPLVPMMADICRPDLLVEIEAVALVPAD